jgi:hypothetical protein
MCNAYSINQAAIGLFSVINRYVGNLPPMPGVFPDYPAPVRRSDPAARRPRARHARGCRQDVGIFCDPRRWLDLIALG